VQLSVSARNQHVPKLALARCDVPQTMRLTRHRITGGLSGKKKCVRLIRLEGRKVSGFRLRAPLLSLSCTKQYNSPAACRAGGVTAEIIIRHKIDISALSLP